MTEMNWDQFVNDAEPNALIPDKLPEGKSLVAITSFGGKPIDRFGNCPSATFAVVEGENAEPGAVCEKAWFVNNGQREGGQAHRANLNAMIGAITGDDFRTEEGRKAIVAKMKPCFDQTRQPLIGVIVAVEGRRKFRKDGSPVQYRDGRPALEYNWHPAPAGMNAPDKVAERRKAILAGTFAASLKTAAPAEVSAAPADLASILG